MRQICTKNDAFPRKSWMRWKNNRYLSNMGIVSFMYHSCLCNPDPAAAVSQSVVCVPRAPSLGKLHPLCFGSLALSVPVHWEDVSAGLSGTFSVTGMPFQCSCSICESAEEHVWELLQVCQAQEDPRVRGDVERQRGEAVPQHRLQEPNPHGLAAGCPQAGWNPWIPR